MRTICYYPELVQITGSINAALMMAQLEFWFKVMEGKPFYKFLEPCSHELYKAGDSWSEELGMTISEVRSAFRRIGTMYKSKSAFLEAMESQDVFKGKPYAAYYDRIRKTTYYLRNGNKVEDMMPQDIGQGCTPGKQNTSTVHESTTKGDGSAQGEITAKRDGSVQRENTIKRDSSAHQDTHPTLWNMGVLPNEISVTEQTQSRLYREDYRANNIEDSIQESLKRDQQTSSPIPFEEIVCLYNDNLGEVLGYVRQLTHKDKNHIKNLWCHLNMQLEDFKKAFMKVAASKFLCGKVEGKKWRANFKWLLAQDHLSKVLEGIYDDFPSSSIATAPPSKQSFFEKIKHFNQIDSHHFDFEEIERLERQYIDRKLEGLCNMNIG